MSDCKDVFQRLDGLERQVRSYEECGKFRCEKEPCSEGEFGPITDDEVLIFLLINPTHFDEKTGTLNPIAFQEVHRRDLSVFRKFYCKEMEIEESIASLIERGMNNVPPKFRQIDQYCQSTCSKVRSLKDESGQKFGVFDTALDEIPSHASIFTRPDIIESKAERAKARRDLHRIFRESIEDISDLTSSAR